MKTECCKRYEYYKGRFTVAFIYDKKEGINVVANFFILAVMVGLNNTSIAKRVAYFCRNYYFYCTEKQNYRCVTLYKRIRWVLV